MPPARLLEAGRDHRCSREKGDTGGLGGIGTVHHWKGLWGRLPGVNVAGEVAGHMRS